MAETTTNVETEHWALKGNTDLVKEIVTRRKAFANEIMASGILPRINRSWSHFHGIFFPTAGQENDMAISMDDEEGGDALANINFTRAIVEQYVTYVLTDKLNWDARATNSDSASKKKAKLFNQLMDAWVEYGGLDEKLERWAKYAAVLAGGWMHSSWDWLKGSPIKGRDGYFSGDFRDEVLSMTEVAWDLVNPDYDEAQWVDVRCLRNRWDLCQYYKGCAAQILAAPPASEETSDYASAGGVGLSYEKTDQIVVHYWYHLPTPSIPEGRMLAYISDKDPLVPPDENDQTDLEAPQPLGIEVLPVVRLVPSEFLLTALGYSFSFDMQVPQEMTGAALSSLINNLNILGQPRMFVNSNSDVRIEDLEPGAGVPVIRGTIKPEELNFDTKLKENAETLQLGKGLAGEMAGIGPVSRGDTSALPKDAPASALAILDSKSTQSTSIFGKRHKRAAAQLANIKLQLAKIHATEPHFIALAGKKNRGKMLEWSAEDFADVQTVCVELGSPIQRSLDGKKLLADTMAERGWINTPEGYLTVVETGQLDDMTGAMSGELEVIADENERIQENADEAEQAIQALELAMDPMVLATSPELAMGIQQHLQKIGVVALKTDNHILHLRMHKEPVASTEARMNRGIMVPNGAHQQQHLNFLSDPEVIRQQALLGYIDPRHAQDMIASMQLPMMAGGMPGAMPGQQVPQEPQGAPAAAPDPGSTSPAPVNETGRPPQAPRVSPRTTQNQIASNLQ
jgi:hypothetical protein